MVKSLILVASTLIPMTRATFGLSPMNMIASPNLWRFRMNHRNTVSASAQSAWAGTMPKQPADEDLVNDVVFECLSMLHRQPARQQDRHAIPEELRGQRRHDRRDVESRHQQAVDIPNQAPAAEREQSQPTAPGGSKVLKTQAKTKPENATTAGKLKSISPAVITRVSPRARMSSGGTVCRKDM